MKPPIEKDAVGSRRRIVVMGGSFNPPTMAHLALLRAAFGDWDDVLVFGNGKGDLFWGEDSYTCAGENRLGRILMAVRKEL